MKELTPFGVRDLMPADVQRHRQIAAIATEEFENNGFEQVITPTIEYYDRLAPGLGAALRKKAIRFLDESGQLLVLRPDHTTPVARLVSMHYRSAKKPVRLFYMDAIFRHALRMQSDDVERMQGGVELFGPSDVAADAEVVGLMIETLKKLGFNNIDVDVGHVGFIKDQTPEQKAALLAGDYLAYGRIPERGGVDLVQDYPDLVGFYEAMTQQGLSEHIRFNKGLIKDLTYYTGIIFECFVEGSRQIVGSGGRYDGLVEKFGYDCPAVGFGLDMDAVADALVQKKGVS